MVKVVLGIVELIVLPHHHGCAFCVVEVAVLGLFFVELVHPCAFETDGVQQEAHQIGVFHVTFFQQVMNHTIGMVGSPLVDDAQRSLVAKAEHRRRSVVVGGCRILESRFQRQFLPVAVEIDGVGNGHSGIFIEQIAFGEHLTAEGVHCGYVSISGFLSARQHAANFLAGDAVGTVVEHAESIGDA